ncbi:glycosyltransferase [Xanthocytophaga flava]|uniref:glycosyltransferase n=1 Tax=Xanthocytophaga flava TaxID=3048013 RepID=UPI0028D23FB2|nr:glycosyltransferase [Xanthocytophaga flavus]MDJ1473327.1 glycosyltransferase [Xanthocytophaga flavus]
MISILIAARNEEDSILTCLQSLNQLTFPIDQLEIWIGDDDSNDLTATLVLKYISDKPHFHYKKITTHLGMARGKANVLAQLIRFAKGSYFLITDADVTVPPNWIEVMLSAHTPGIGIISGVTVSQPVTLWIAMQAIDWAQALCMIYHLSHWGIPISGLGNNMLVTKEAYKATGGYENMRFSISEDHQLFKAVLKKGYGFRQLFAADCLVETQGLPTFDDLINQRKRWMNAAMQTPWYIRMLTLLPLFLLPIIVISFITQPFTSLLSWIGLLLIQGLITLSCVHGLKAHHLYIYALIYPVYFHFITFSTLIQYALASPTYWKGRRYELTEIT